MKQKNMKLKKRIGRVVLPLVLMLCFLATGSPAFCHTVTIGIEYDSAGRVEQLIHPNQRVETFTYNGLDRQDTVSYGLIDVVTSTDFTPSGLVSGREISPAVGGSGASETRSYDALGRLTSQRLDVGTTVYHAFEIAYDERGYIASLRRDDALLVNTSVDYEYTEQGQLYSLSFADQATATSTPDFIRQN